MVKSIYPSIPMPGSSLDTITPAVEAIRQTVNLIILNGLSPNPNYTPSETAQVFVTYSALTKIGVVGPPGPMGPQGPAGSPGISEAPNDVNMYARHALGWTSLGPATTVYVPEAPNDANMYARHANGWYSLGPFGPLVPEAPNDANYYARHALAWQNLAVTVGGVSTAGPPAVTSATYLMQGLGLRLTPVVATRMLVAISGNISNTTAGAETDLQLYYGTGASPANGAAVTGSPIGSVSRIRTTAGADIAPFAKTLIVSGLTLGTTYWFDVAMKVVSGSGTIDNVDFVGHGVL